MIFDDIPENKIESYPCDYCAGSVTKRDDGWWSCDVCDFEVESDEVLNK